MFDLTQCVWLICTKICFFSFCLQYVPSELKRVVAYCNYNNKMGVYMVKEIIFRRLERMLAMGTSDVG